MKRGDITAWISTQNGPQTEYGLHNQDTQVGGIQRQTRIGVIAAEVGQEFEVHWKCTTNDSKFDLHVRVWFHNLRVASGVFTPEEFGDAQTVDGDFNFGIPETTDFDEAADPFDPNVATIRLEFQWVKRCAKYLKPKRRCIDCTKSHDAAGGRRRANLSRSAPYRVPDYMTNDIANVIPGLVHERAKKAHWPSAVVTSYVELHDDLDQDEGEWHGTFKKRTILKFVHAPMEYIQEQGWADLLPPSTANDPPSPLSELPADSEDQDQKPDISTLSLSDANRDVFENPQTEVDFEVIEVDSDEEDNPGQPSRSLIKREEQHATIEEDFPAHLHTNIFMHILRQEDEMLRQTTMLLQQQEETREALFRQQEMTHQRHNQILGMLAVRGRVNV